MKRTELIDQLVDIQFNIESTEKRINTIKTSPYYDVWHFAGGKPKQKHDIEIQSKCLDYWKRKFNRVSFKLMYNL